MDIKIDFGNFRDTLLVCLEKKERPSSSDRVHMVKVISQTIFEIYEQIKKLNPTLYRQKTPGRAVYKSVVDAIFTKFAVSFEDKINGKLIRDGKFSLTDEIETCVENKYRSKKCATERVAATKGNRSAACILPNKYSPPMTKAMKAKGDEIQRELLALYGTPSANWDWEHIKSTLVDEASLAAQRAMITSKNRDMSLIIERWPFLFEVSGLLCHLDHITGSSMIRNFEKFIDTDMEDLLQFLSVMSPQRVKILKIGKAVAVGNGPLLHRKLLGAISMLAAHWGEDPSVLISCTEDTTLCHEVGDIPVPSPHIVALGDNPYLAKGFYLIMDGVCVCSNISNGLEAVMALCAAFFVFGVLYPPQAGATMTFVERFMANLSDCSGLVKAQTTKGAVSASSGSKCLQIQKDIESFARQMDGDD